MDYLVHPSVSEEIDNCEADPLTGNIIGAAIDVHRALGPGLLESAYEACLVYELRLRQLKVEAQLLSYLRLYGTYASPYFSQNLEKVGRDVVRDASRMGSRPLSSR